MRPILVKISFVLALIAYLIVRLARIDVIQIPSLVNNYLSDLVCMPIILSLSLFILRKIKRLPKLVLTPLMIFGMTSFYAVLFEFILPYYSNTYTGDKWDVVMYFIGATIYWGINLNNRRAVSR